MKKLMIALFALAAFTACDKDNNEENPTADRTVLIYMAGENNLTSWDGNRFADDDLLQIKEGVKGMGRNNLIVYVDKAESQNPYFLCYANGELKDSIATEADELTADPAVLEKVARKAFTDYPAKSYGLVLWGHSTGWLINSDSVKYTSMARMKARKAYGGDTGNNTTSNSGRYWMNIPSMAKALARLPHLTYIFADCCNFMCLETAYELRNCVDYIIGSPAEIPGEGAPYDKIVPALFEVSSFYTSIVDIYYAQRSSGLDLPLSVVKTSEMENLASATRTTLQSFADSFGGSYPDLSNLIHYYYDYVKKQEFYDANDFMLKFASANDYTAWKQALDRAVVYKKMAKSWMINKESWYYYYGGFEMTEERYGGVSMFIPQLNYRGTDNTDIQQMAWYYAAGYKEIGW